jgi:predicted ATP-dependent serine protease
MTLRAVPKNYRCQECQKKFYGFKEACIHCGAIASLLPIPLEKKPKDFRAAVLNLIDDYVALQERTDHYEQIIALLQQKVKRYRGEVDELVEILNEAEKV